MNQNTLNQLLSKVGDKIQHHKEMARLTGADFNIFKVIRVDEDEVKHSRFIADLLNPKGRHGQGTIFLKLFIDKTLKINNFNYESAEIVAEKDIGPINKVTGGKIDIYIDDKNGNKIAIENKINAEDQPNQLIRYHNYCPKYLFYLTLYGKEPKPISTTFKEKQIVFEDKDFKLLSYQTDILSWMEKCLKEAVQLPLLREGIAHYINTVKSLTGQSTNKKLQMDIVKTVTLNPANLSTAKELIKNWILIKADVQLKFWNALSARLNQGGLSFTNQEKMFNEKKVKDYYSKTKNPPRRFGIRIHLGSIGEYHLHWGCYVNASIYSGFIIEKNRNDKIADNIEFKNYRELLLNHNSFYKTDNPAWLVWDYTNPRLNFNSFDSEEIFKLTDDNQLNETVTTITEQAKKEIEFVRKEILQQPIKN